MNSQVSPVAPPSPTPGTSGGGQSQPTKASDAVQRSSGTGNPGAPEVPALGGLDGSSSQAVDEQAVEEIVEGLNGFAQDIQRQLQFTIDEDTGKTVIKVIDVATEQLIRQIPLQDLLELQRRLGDMEGLLFETMA